MVESKNSWGADNQNKEQKAGGEWSEDRSEITKSSPKNDKEAWGDKNKGGEQKAAGWDATDNSESWGGGGGGSSATANTDFGSKDRGGDRGPRQERPPREENASGESTTVFVGGLGYRTTEETVNEFFGTAGTVVGVRIAMNQEDNRPRGFCHVEFDTPESAQKAVDTLSGQALDGRNIRIEISRPRGGGGGRGGGGAGRGDRTGSGCYKCGEEGHISRDCPQGGGGAGRGGGGGSRACYKCGEEGHISRECPQAGGDSRDGGGRGGGDRGGQSGSRACYKCGEEGHISRDCPQASGSGDRGGGRGGGGGSRACYKCGEEGHIARDCSQEGGDNDRGGGGRPRGGGGYGGSYSGSREFSDHGNVNSDPYKRSNNDSKGWSGGAGGFNEVFGDKKGGEAKDSGSGWNGDSRGNDGGAWK